ncbi:MAG: hypothetical protein M3R57_02985 [Chloroflexota bacterium]|nr:hypothetical protein [Chloroflexota bacterium]
MSSRKGATIGLRRRATTTPTRSLTAALLIGHLEIRRLLELRLEATGLDALDAIVIRMLLVNEKASIGDIRETLALPASTATHVIDRLCDRRYARREAGFDRRVIFVRLTGVGEEVARMVDETIRELDREIYATAETASGDIIRLVDAIELLASRERRLRIRRR